jgi:crotonobetainyl-CoA:carnitine CoA-transferase CaiB-like acyl-CoA transferase
MAGSLDGLRVLDFSRVLAGPFATMMLGDLGAEVIKIERPDGGDDTRSWGPPYDSRGRASYFLSVNRNKRSLSLDLTDAGDRERARRLCAGADVLIENFRPGLMDRFGLGYEQLRASNGGLVYCTISGFGSDNGQLPGYDLLAQALGGLMSITGSPDGPPQKVGVAVVDVLCGLFAAVGILAALRHRELTGAGQRVEVDLLSSLLSALVNQAAAHTAGGVVPGRLGNRHPSIAPYESLRCADGELVVAVGNDRQFALLCRTLGIPELATQERFATNPARVGHREALIEALEGRLRTRPAAAWAQELTAARVPAGTVNDIAQAFALAERLGLDPLVDLGEPGSPTRLPRNPIRLSATPASYRLPPPDLGELPPSAAWRCGAPEEGRNPQTSAPRARTDPADERGPLTSVAQPKPQSQEHRR